MPLRDRINYHIKLKDRIETDRFEINLYFLVDTTEPTFFTDLFTKDTLKANTLDNIVSFNIANDYRVSFHGWTEMSKEGFIRNIDGGSR